MTPTITIMWVRRGAISRNGTQFGKQKRTRKSGSQPQFYQSV